MKIESTDSFNRSHIYLDIAAARRAQSSADHIADYERRREQLESFTVESSLADIGRDPKRELPARRWKAI